MPGPAKFLFRSNRLWFNRSPMWLCIVLTVLVACLLTGLGCNEPTPTPNPVRSISMKDFGELLQSSSFTGLVAVVASWCAPCKTELPDLVKLHEQYHPRGIRIVALSIDEGGPQAIQPLIDRLNVSFPVYWSGQQAVAVYNLVGIPTLIVVRDGKIAGKLPGQQSHRAMEQTIQELLR
ncbi:MAG: TlpA family protein disulfide reductase [Desulfatitalea sp.]|nr:TlpA family protein disulfide reductase [Desulfatitalea sp.]NNK01246.1 TlpA family protein disulfide reductase [Desulfatitalea sp.]